ncbi:MAG: LysR family transcriptional regulator [Phormidesmis sp.]
MSKSIDRLALLETFIRIAEAGSISAAARDLGLSQPSVSRQLAELELRFNVQLIRRTTHSLSLTQAGAELLADARRLLDDWEVLEEKHIDLGEALQGKLKIVAPVALGQLHLVVAALKFQQTHPLVSISWHLEDSDIRFAEVGCDCWIKVGPIPDHSLLSEPLGQAERIVVASPQFLTTYGRHETPEDLGELPCVALDPFEGRRIPLTNREDRTVLVSPPVQMNTNNIFALRQAVLAGLGIAVMPRWLISDELEKGTLVDFIPKWRAPKLTIYAASLPERHRPRRLHRFIERLKAEIHHIPGIG